MLGNILGIRNNTKKKLGCSAAMFVYPSQEGGWRGFVRPYDITIEADTKEKAIEALREMVETYEEILEEYNHPEHLCTKPFSNEEDRVFFDKIALEALVERKKVETDSFYAEALPA